MTQTDLIIIGAGPGGYETAVSAARRGMSTVIVEAAHVGGTCLNEGCIPTKCFCRHADLLRDLRDADRLGLDSVSFQFHMDKVVQRKDEVVRTLAGGVESLLSSPLIRLVKGVARFGASAHEVVVGDEAFEAPHVIIATGSVTKVLPIEGRDLPDVVTSTEMLRLQEVPRRLCVIGGGVIGMEFASIFQAFGSEVTVVEFCKEILPAFDADIAKRLRQSLKSQGINIVTSAAVKAILQTSDGLSVTYEQKGQAFDIAADVVLMAVGRAANVSSLNLDAVGIRFTPRGIDVDDNYETNVPGIYAIGDVNGRCQLAHAATFQGLRALNHINRQVDDLRFDLIPAAVFTHPEAATVGLTTEACKERGMTIKAHKAFFRANGKALALGETEGLVKILTDEQDNIVGCHLFGPHASDLIHELTAVMKCGGKLSNLRSTIHAHPTLSEVILSAAID